MHNCYVFSKKKSAKSKSDLHLNRMQIKTKMTAGDNCIRIAQQKQFHIDRLARVI